MSIRGTEFPGDRLRQKEGETVQLTEKSGRLKAGNDWVQSNGKVGVGDRTAREWKRGEIDGGELWLISGTLIFRKRNSSDAVHH